MNFEEDQNRIIIPSDLVNPESTTNQEHQERDIQHSRVSWDTAQGSNFFSRLWNTWTDVMFSPQNFFSKMPLTNGLGFPLLYAIIFSIIGIILSIPSGMMSQNLYSSIYFLKETHFTFYTILFTVIFSPFLFSIWYFTLSGTYHLGILLLGGKGNFEGTFRTIAFSTSTSVFGVIPFFGGLITFIYTIILYSYGFRNIHNFSSRRATFAAILPIMLISAFIIIFVAGIILLLGSSFLMTIFKESGYNI